MPYTTAELIAILDAELRASWQGRRQLLNPAERIQDAVVAKALDPRRLSQVFAYQDFVAEVHAYQREHNVSGLVWRTCRWHTLSVELPERHPQLIAIATDYHTLQAARPAIIQFWQQATAGFLYWRVGDSLEAITATEAKALIAAAEWLELDITQDELYLGLCWGDPNVCHHGWAAPESGCQRLVAAATYPHQALRF